MTFTLQKRLKEEYRCASHPPTCKRSAALMASTTAVSAAAMQDISQPVSVAVRLPTELLGTVFEHLAADHRSLASAARTCRAWTPPAIRVLWRAPLPAALLCVTGEQPQQQRRRDMYGAAVRTLAIHEDAAPLDRTADWCFPVLRSLHYDFTAAPQQPRALEQFLGRCGPLLVAAAVGQNSSGLFSFTMPRISPGNICTECNDDTRVSLSGDTLACFARHAVSLRSFTSQAHVSRDAVAQCLAAISAATNGAHGFRRLENMAVTVTADAVPALVTLIGHSPLASLRLSLTCRESRQPFFALLSRLHHLRELYVWRWLWDRLDAEDFVQLRHVAPQLQSLRLEASRWPNVNDRIPPVTDSDLEAVVSRFPELRRLSLSFGGHLTPAALRIVGERCRRLRTMRLPVPCDIAALECSAEAVLFPDLREMHVEFPVAHHDEGE
jgi:hypothetical protein